MNKEEIIKTLKEVALFSDIKEDHSALFEVADMMEVKHIKKGHFIIKEGEEGHEMYILFNGVVEIRKNTLDNDFYVVTNLESSQHAFFGEMAMIDNDRRSASVVAKTDCDILVLSSHKFLELGNQDPKVGLLVTRKISQILGQRLRRGNQDLVTLFEALVGEIEEKT